MLHAPSLHRALETALAVCVLVLASMGSAVAYDARVSWSPVAGSTGYTIYTRGVGENFGTGVDVGALAPGGDGTIRYVLTGLDRRSTTYFAVTSRGVSGESAPSNEIALTYATLAAIVDSDDDGLTDAQEDRDLDMVVDPGETNALLADSDGDGVSDGVEVAQGTDPLDPASESPPASPTASATSTPARTATAVPTATGTTTPLPTATRTATPISTATRTATPVRTATQTATPTATKTPTPTRTATQTSTPTRTATPVRTATAVPTVTVTRTATPVPTATATPVPTTTATATSVPSATATETAVPTTTATATAVPTATRTAVPTATATTTPEPSATQTAVPTGTATAQPTGTATATAGPTGTATTVPTSTATRTPEPTTTPERTATVVPTATFVPTATATGTPQPTLTPTSVATPTGDDLTALGSIIARVPLATGAGNKDLEVIRDGDMPPVGTNDAKRQYDTNDGRNASDEDWIGYAFASPQAFSRVVFQEGMHFSRGGWFSSLTVHVRQNGLWTAVSSLTITPAYPAAHNGVSYETYTLQFASVVGDAIRIWGRPGGKDDFVSVGELRVFHASMESPNPHPTMTATPVRTATPIATATLPPAPTATATAGATAVPTTAPTAAATPVPASCGNDVRNGREECDGRDAGSCPGLCQADCTCASSYTFPLEGWVTRKSKGNRALATNDGAGRNRVLVIEGTLDDEIGYPERPTLALPFPILSFTTRSEDGARLQVGVRGVDGKSYVLSYAAAEGVPLASKRQSSFPVGSKPKRFETKLRDLDADLRASFNVGFASVTQVTVRGTMRVAEVMVAARGVLPDVPAPAPEIMLPAGGWSQQGLGTVVENEYDTELDAPTIRTEPRDSKRGRIAIAFPKKASLVAAYRTFSLVVRDEQKLAIEVRVRVGRGVARLRYDAAVDQPVVKGRKTTLPLVPQRIDGSSYRLITIDLASDVPRVLPGATLDGVLGIRVQGKVRMGDLILSEPLP